MGRIILPCSEPIIKGYLFFAFPLSIIGYNEKTAPWILSNYIQMRFDKDYINSPVPYTFYAYEHHISPWLCDEEFSRNILNFFEFDIISWVKNCIEQKKYVYLYLDEYYMPGRTSFGKLNFAHENLIFGYNDDLESFDVLGFDDKGIFKPVQLTYDKFVDAYMGIEKMIYNEKFNNQNTTEESIYYFNTVKLFRFNNSGQYSFNYKLTKNTLRDYTNGTNTSELFSMVREPYSHFVFGIDCYSYIHDYYKSLLKKEVGFDVRYIHNVWEHKLLMTKRVEYMNNNKRIELSQDIVSQFKTVENRALILRNLMLKFRLNGNNKHIHSIMDGLSEIAEQEVFLINTVLQN
ncbi:hypothetical protein SAMN04488542_12058 [Fontibacillus panacisegetis]|uniref:Uncharacterized protein n=1 Tax=Fontibacillus panacisegetis TaxID=670482 RepID=A0A1G7PZK6_9BACL|nr:hypothetical protein [Fontibacillus panacisegetis]SDF91695.1 hypothetical protein SAMN04488542_12058 [Fontibacillus panacisegetis]